MNREDLIKLVSKRVDVKEKYVDVVLGLLEEGNTVAFIARYRKELTGAMDEEKIREISLDFEYQKNLNDRKEAVIRLIDEKGLLTEELVRDINRSEKLSEVEDLYRPFKEKKKTRATIAEANGLKPLAEKMLSFQNIDYEKEALNFINDKVLNVEDAISGAMDIVAEKVSDTAKYRKQLKDNIDKYGFMETKLVKKNASLDELETYKSYYDFKERLNKLKAYQVLAINRAESEKIITVKIVVDDEFILDKINKNFIKKDSSSTKYLVEAIKDAYKRLIFPSVEREKRSELKEESDEKAIKVFSDNLENLLLTPALKDKNFLGVDPAYRTGCKVAVVDKNANVLEIDKIYQNQKNKDEVVPEKRIKEAEEIVLRLIKKYDVKVIAIGNGTASRETESFIGNLIEKNHLDVSYIIVSEAGASVYSASDNAIKEFPDLLVEERSAISIARRVIDPLSELVKIDPKSIGVGEYQHDVNQVKLRDSLDFTVSKVVNRVGVNINTASLELLKYVSGINQKIAQNIKDYVETIGAFKTREELLKVKGLGAKTYNQAVGFLRILNSKNPLDKTAIHPESYGVALDILSKLGLTSESIGTSKLKGKIDNTNLDELFKTCDTDRYTFDDIIQNLKEPLRDLRDSYDAPILKKSILHLEDIQVGEKLEGTVRNVTSFGAFVDLGVKVDGLLHVSKISKKFVKDPNEILKVGQIVKVTVIDVDVKRNRLAISMID